MFGAFSGAAMAAVGRAQDGAIRRGATEIDATDVILAALAGLEPVVDKGLATLARQLTARAEADPTGLPSEPDSAGLSRLSESAPADRIPDQRLPFAESAIATFRGAWKKAKWDGRLRVDEYDLLTAGVEQPALAPARSQAGVDLDQLRTMIGELRHIRPR